MDPRAALHPADHEANLVGRAQLRLPERAPQYRYRGPRELFEPDWRRLPGYRDVTEAEWRDARWQRQNGASGTDDLKRVFGSFLPESLAASIDRDHREFGTMPILVPPQMLNTMDEANLWEDPIRRYMLPAADERDRLNPSHPMSMRDSLHEADMWVVDGLTHRYPTKVLAELLTTCPQYCGHCTRMDLVGRDVPQVRKQRFPTRSAERYTRMLDYLRGTPSVRDVVVSGGDIANLPLHRLEEFTTALISIPHIRDVRLASKALVTLPQYFLRDDVQRVLERLAEAAEANDVDLAIHAHVNHAHSITPLVAEVTGRLRNLGIRSIRNQGVLLRGVNETRDALLDLCFALLDGARITPYYFYMCDMVPNSEHWRLPLHAAQRLQDEIMGYLPGFATPRIVCDVPLVGKRLVHQCESYDRTTGISTWRAPAAPPARLAEEERPAVGVYYDPIWSLGDEGARYWRWDTTDARARVGPTIASSELPEDGRAAAEALTGEGRACAHHGEILQGIFEHERGPVLGLLTLPYTRFETHCLAVLESGGSELAIRPADRVKALAAARGALEALQAGKYGGTITLSSNIPIGRGFGSSTSDIVAAVRAVADALGSTLSPQDVAALAVRAEIASDPLMFDHALLFAQRESSIVEDFRTPLPAMEIVGFSTSENELGIDTLALDPSAYALSEIEEYRPLRALARRSLAIRDVAGLGRVATTSAILNQRRLPVPVLPELLEIVARAGAAGVAVAHSGDVAAFLFDPVAAGVKRCISVAEEALAAIGITSTWRFAT
jgi:lysine 2,3-aminomutase